MLNICLLSILLKFVLSINMEKRFWLKQRSLVIAGLCRDSAAFLPHHMSLFKDLEKYFQRVSYVFVENDSKDETKNHLSDFSKNRDCKIISMDGLGWVKQRTKRLEIARNAYLRFIKNNDSFASSDYLIIADLDDAISENLSASILLGQINLLQDQKSIAGIFPVTNPSYYDLWALRSDECSSDIYLEIAEKMYFEKRLDDNILKSTFLGSHQLFNFKVNNIFDVDSAFGGVGVYRMSDVLANPKEYKGTELVEFKDKNGTGLFSIAQVCEHVEFHKGLKLNGQRLVINPKFVSNSKCNHTPAIRAFVDLYENFAGKKVFSAN